MTELEQEAEIYHHGVVGMKWGAHRVASKTKANSKLNKKALNYDVKVAKLNRQSEKYHSKNDLGSSNRAAKLAANYRKKAAVNDKKSLNVDNDSKKERLQKKAGKFQYKAAKKQLEANRISKTSGYGMKAMKLSIKSDRVAIKAAKARKKILYNKAYIAKMNRKVSSITESELNMGKAYLSN